MVRFIRNRDPLSLLSFIPQPLEICLYLLHRGSSVVALLHQGRPVVSSCRAIADLAVSVYAATADRLVFADPLAPLLVRVAPQPDSTRTPLDLLAVRPPLSLAHRQDSDSSGALS